MLTLCYSGPPINFVFNNRGTFKMFLINRSGTEQVFAYQPRLPAVLYFDSFRAHVIKDIGMSKQNPNFI